MKDTFPYAVLTGGLAAAFAYFVAPEWLDLMLVGLAVTLGALVLGALAVYLLVLRLAAGDRRELRAAPWSSITLISIGAVLLMWISAAAGGAAGQAAAVVAPVLGLIGAGFALWTLRRRGNTAA